jgi:hypothetical protein
MGAHIVVTKDKGLLANRADGRLREANLMSPTEAGVLMGVWARAAGHGGTFSHFRPAEPMYYWALTRALVPASWTSFGAWIRGARVFPDGDRLADLAQSVLARLDYLVETVDEMAVTWQRQVGNDAIDRLTGLFDDVLLRTWAIQDNLALLVGAWLQIDLPNRMSSSFHNHGWRRAVRATGQAGRSLVESTAALRRLLAASEELRHHAVHRESLGGLRYRTETGEEARIRLPASKSKPIVNRLRSSGHDPEAWGIGPEFGPAIVHHSVDHGGGLKETFEEQDPGGAFLDPMFFAVRLTATVAHLSNEVFRILDPVTDPRLPEQLRERALMPPTEHWLTAEVGRELILTSPLSGLVSWTGDGRRV